MEGEVLLRVKNLVTEFETEDQTIRAVSNISFDIGRGETVGLVGESGSGKSVTALSIMRLVLTPPGRISNGEIHLQTEEGDIDLLKLPEKEMRQHRGNDIAMIFQEPMTSLNPVFSCGNQVVEAIRLHQKLSHKASVEKAIEAFRDVKLKDPERIFHSYPHQISGGQKQRVMIAMAIACEPSLLIADEPSTALDVTVQKAILDLINEIQLKRNIGVLFITHDLGVIAEVADRVLVMYKGKIVEEGNVIEIFNNPRHPYTKGLLACRPPLNKRMHWLPTIADFLNVDEEGEIRESGNTVEEMRSKLLISKEERKQRQKELYSEKPILQVKNLRTYYVNRRDMLGRVRDYNKAVDGVNFEVYKGETLGLVGESGCGKSTLGRSMLRLINPFDGEVIYKGINLFNLSERQMRGLRKKMQIIFQDPYSSLNPRITVGEAIMEPMQVHNILATDRARKIRVIELLERVNMNEMHFYRYPHEFSGGQRQRICIARALSLNPEFIICDESVSALDVSVQAQVLNLLNELKNDFNFTYIFISHDLSVVKFMSDRMMVMKDGVIVEIGDADAIYSHPTTEYTRHLINAIPKGEISQIKKRVELKAKKKIERLTV
ncbi:MAG: ABC transporter ATP-binding protein [Flavobacteriales bacterium]